MAKIELSPLCLPDKEGTRLDKMPMAVNNRGYLLPCCWCDEKNIINSKQFKPLYDVSKLEDYNSINEILETKEWIEFENDLININDFQPDNITLTQSSPIFPRIEL